MVTALRPQSKQTNIPGTERKTIDEIETAAHEYRNTVAERVALQQREKELKEVLVQAMSKHELETYVYADEEGEELTVKVTHKTKVSVRKSKNVEDESEGEN